MFKEFKAFIMRGNVVDLAVGVIIGAAFGKIISSLVNDILMPPISLLLGNVDFSNLFLVIKGAEKVANGNPLPALHVAVIGRRRYQVSRRNLVSH